VDGEKVYRFSAFDSVGADLTKKMLKEKRRREIMCM